MIARIYRPSPNAMQSGRGKSNEWVLVYEPEAPRSIDPLMGYTSSTDMKQQVRLRFSSLEEAEAYAVREGIAYSVQPAQNTTVKKVSYPDNFRYDRKAPWTH
ncbi:ETC complex I subunit [Pelagibacterium lentulum]|uniref:NADH-ubiquinone oxidoreductase n=1 Tax=Pelagibacterium lentulum TaxID=2029865 RepID=A0A916RC85_9HYPH|nr:ETC complex I subunit [Pelagibacterium lentulum]GGA51577.1 NADH-ubiquinone oxidoreductase [Pelagibacterium lentulum]